VIEDVTIDTPKTKDFVAILQGLNADDKKVLFLTPEYNNNVFLSYRNLPNVAGYQFHDMNTYDIVNSEVLVFTESAVKKIVEDVKQIN
jgi:large subunit ribosomal protein L4